MRHVKSSPMELHKDDILTCLEGGMNSFNLMEFLVVCSCVILIAFLLTEILDWSQIFSFADLQKPYIGFGYAHHNGPKTWGVEFPKCLGECQSPVNIITAQAVVVMNSNVVLTWQNYDIIPENMTVTNDGHTVILTGDWLERPFMFGGPLGEDEYDFYCLMFHWGRCDSDGSEHMLDNNRYAMELQMVLLKRGYISPFQVANEDAKEGIAVVSFLFQIAPVDNPLLDPIVNNLSQITFPDISAMIPAFPLSSLYQSFEHNYYTYSGSMTQPPCCEGVIWIIQPEPIAVSSRQIKRFRSLYSEDGRLCSNLRPIQPLNNRDVFFYD